MKCKRCGTLLREDALYCHECGLKKGSDFVCPNCGQVLETGVKFCSNCGNNIIVNNQNLNNTQSYQNLNNTQDFQNTQNYNNTQNYQNTQSYNNIKEGINEALGGDPYLELYNVAKEVFKYGIIAYLLCWVPIAPIILAIKAIKIYKEFKVLKLNMQQSNNLVNQMQQDGFKWWAIIGLILAILALINTLGITLIIFFSFILPLIIGGAIAASLWFVVNVGKQY